MSLSCPRVRPGPCDGQAFVFVSARGGLCTIGGLLCTTIPDDVARLTSDGPSHVTHERHAAASTGAARPLFPRQDRVFAARKPARATRSRKVSKASAGAQTTQLL